MNMLGRAAAQYAHISGVLFSTVFTFIYLFIYLIAFTMITVLKKTRLVVTWLTERTYLRTRPQIVRVG